MIDWSGGGISISNLSRILYTATRAVQIRLQGVARARDERKEKKE